MTPAELVRFIHSRRLSLNDEKVCQRELASEFAAADVDYEREVRLSRVDIIDFVLGEIGLEIKLKGQRREIYRQCERYCQHEQIKALVLATNAAMGMPAEINGRPVFVAYLGKAWL